MQPKVSARGQIAIPVKIRKTHNLKKDVRVEWIDDGSHIVLIPLPEDPVAALKGAYRGLLSTEDLLKEREGLGAGKRAGHCKGNPGVSGQPSSSIKIPNLKLCQASFACFLSPTKKARVIDDEPLDLFPRRRLPCPMARGKMRKGAS